ncbi:MAG: flavin reductase family protein [Chloroflexi bacterium]|nr:flavin reductase family protein [Chloroflexota bacterium]
MTIGSEQYRNALRHFPAGVTIVTIKAPGYDKPHGLTVSVFASISPKPPLIMIAIDHRGVGHEMLQIEGAVFVVNILPQDKMELSNRFAWVKDVDRFAEGEWGTAVTGAPILKDALAWLDCTVHHRYGSRHPHPSTWARWRPVTRRALMKRRSFIGIAAIGAYIKIIPRRNPAVILARV